MHRPGLRHTNVDALSRNPTRLAKEDDDFCEEIQDIGDTHAGSHTEEGRLLIVQNGTEMEWLEIRRKGRKSVQHHTCCFGINHSMQLNDHHLYMIDIVSEISLRRSFRVKMRMKGRMRLPKAALLG